MDHDERREILERIEALERLVRSSGEGRGDRERWERRRHERGRHRGNGEFQEKRVIDTIVRLVSEQVGLLLGERHQQERQPRDGGGEKRIVDLIVGLVSEHVREIVATELDRRFGRAGAPGAGEGGSPGPPPPGGCPEGEPR